MKFTIYKLSGKFNSHRWWRNYDANNIATPDIDIETYISNKGLTWSVLQNSRNENIGYQTITKDSFDKISLKIKDLKDIPDYIKITFTKDNNVTESMYYYVDISPSIYNARTALVTDVTYILDKKASYYFKFHNYLKTLNPNMFYVRKHYPRMLKDSTTNRYYFDFNLQPWLKINNDQKVELITEDKTSLTKDDIVTQALDSNSNRYYRANNGLLCKTGESVHTIKVLTYTNESSSDTFIQDLYVLDSNFVSKGGLYEYVLTKTKCYSGTHNMKPLTKFMVWPILGSRTTYPEGMETSYWGYHNSLDLLSEKFPTVFADDNIIGRFTSPISPSALMNLYTDNRIGSQAQTGGDEYLGIAVMKKSGDIDKAGFIIVDGYPKSFTINGTKFEQDIQTILNNFNNGTYNKTKANNPHLLAPQNKQLYYANSSNDATILNASYFNLNQTTTPDNMVKFDTLLASGWYSRFVTDYWSNTKMLSQSGNELLISDAKQAPIECSAWNNTWLQRQVLDTGRNAQVKSGTTSLVAGGLGIGLSALSFLLGPVGWIAGTAGLIGSITGVAKSAINLQNGLAQNAMQRKALEEQAGTLNAPVDISGLSIYSTGISGLNYYSRSLSEQDSNEMNNDDNMYGYYIKSWLPYTDYQTCWDGNYVLIDMSRNYANIFNKLKTIDSMFTIDDNYVNEFINALNNGICWYDNGTYVDLATDEYNWERTFPRHV